MTDVKITHKQATLKPVGPMMRVCSSGRLSRIGGIALFVGKHKMLLQYIFLTII